MLTVAGYRTLFHPLCMLGIWSCSLSLLFISFYNGSVFVYCTFILHYINFGGGASEGLSVFFFSAVEFKHQQSH